jgi:hypothetical protein
LIALSMSGNDVIRGGTHPDVAHINGIMPHLS